MPALTGLDGTDGKEIECNMVRTMTAAIKSLRSGVPATAAGDNGAISSWKDNDGKWRCSHCRYLHETEQKIYGDLKSVAKWWKRWLPKIR